MIPAAAVRAPEDPGTPDSALVVLAGRVGRLSLFALLVGQCDGGGGAGKGGGPVVIDGALGYMMRGGDLMVGGVGPRRPAQVISAS